VFAARDPLPTPARDPMPAPTRDPLPTPARDPMPAPPPAREPLPTPTRDPLPTPARDPVPAPTRDPLPAPARNPLPTPAPSRDFLSPQPPGLAPPGADLSAASMIELAEQLATALRVFKGDAALALWLFEHAGGSAAAQAFVDQA